MPVPLTTAAFVFAALLLPISETGTLIMGVAGVLNQLLVTFAPRDED